MLQKILKIATRESPLALWQSNFIRENLLKHWPKLKIELYPMKTSGDKFLKDRLVKLGGKGLFVKELEASLLDNKADIAVHSMKDVPANFPKGLSLPVICRRENPLDSLVSNSFFNLESLPIGSIVGTSSMRRQSQLLYLRPDLLIKVLRGNIHTRLKKLDDGEYDAIILAAAGLQRMGMNERITELLTENIMLPACGQGALGIECRSNDLEIQSLIAPLNDTLTALCVHTERQVNAALGGSCHTSIAIYCKPTADLELLLQAKVGNVDGTTVINNRESGPLHNAPSLAANCAASLMEAGAEELLATLSTS